MNVSKQPVPSHAPGDPALDGTVDTPFELIERLVISRQFEQFIVRQVFRIFMGDNETLGDAKTLPDAYKELADGIATGYPKDRQLKTSCDPRNPCVSVLEPGLPGKGW